MHCLMMRKRSNCGVLFLGLDAWNRKPKGQIDSLLGLKNLDIPINDYKTRAHLNKKIVLRVYEFPFLR